MFDSILNMSWILKKTVSVENGPSYMFDRVLSIPPVLSLLGLEDTRAVNILMLHMVLCKLYFKDSWYFECLEF